MKNSKNIIMCIVFVTFIIAIFGQRPQIRNDNEFSGGIGLYGGGNGLGVTGYFINNTLNRGLIFVCGGRPVSGLNNYRPELDEDFVEEWGDQVVSKSYGRVDFGLGYITHNVFIIPAVISYNSYLYVEEGPIHIFDDGYTIDGETKVGAGLYIGYNAEVKNTPIVVSPYLSLSSMEKPTIGVMLSIQLGDYIDTTVSLQQ